MRVEIGNMSFTGTPREILTTLEALHIQLPDDTQNTEDNASSGNIQVSRTAIIPLYTPDDAVQATTEDLQSRVSHALLALFRANSGPIIMPLIVYPASWGTGESPLPTTVWGGLSHVSTQFGEIPAVGVTTWSECALYVMVT